MIKVQAGRYMRLLLFFDLPTKTPINKYHYRQFREFLLRDGYVMLQFSVYSRIIKGEESIDKHEKRLIVSLPPEGSIRLLSITESQYCKMKILLGKPSYQENHVNASQILLF